MQNDKNPILENSALATVISLVMGAMSGVSGIMVSGAEDASRVKAYLALFVPLGLLIAALASYLIITKIRKRSSTVGAKVPFRFHAQTLLSVLLGSVIAVIFGYTMISALTTQTKSSIPGNALMIIGIIGVGVTVCIGLILIGLQRRGKQALKKRLERRYWEEGRP